MEKAFPLVDVHVLNSSTKGIYSDSDFFMKFTWKKTWGWGLTRSAKPTEVREGDLLSGVHNVCISTAPGSAFLSPKKRKRGFNLYIFTFSTWLAWFQRDDLLAVCLLKSESAAVSEITFL